jgi:hypothetical protein
MPNVLPFQPHNALPASGPVPAVPLPVRPNSLTKSDVTALRSLMPELAAGSRYATGCDDAGDVRAIISGGNGETFQAYLLTRVTGRSWSLRTFVHRSVSIWSKPMTALLSLRQLWATKSGGVLTLSKRL